MHQALVDTVKCSMVLLPLLRDDTEVASKFVDMRDDEFVEFHVHVGSADTTLDVKIQESDNADGSLPSDVSGAAVTQVTALGDNVMLVLSAHKSALSKRYVGLSVDPGNGIAGVDVCAEAFRWGGPARLPRSQESAGSNSYATSQVIRVGAPS